MSETIYENQIILIKFQELQWTLLFPLDLTMINCLTITYCEIN